MNMQSHAMTCDNCNYFTSTYKDLSINQRSRHGDLSPASDHSDCKILEPSFENKYPCNFCDLISKTKLSLKTHSKGQQQQHRVFPGSHPWLSNSIM